MPTLGLQVSAGRLFAETFVADTGYRLVVNEAAVRDLGFLSAEQAVGSKLFFDWQGETFPFEVIGVVKDFHFQDLHVPVAPYAFQVVNNGSEMTYMLVQAKDGADMSALLASIGSDWSRLNPNEPFEYSFLDEDFGKNYEADQRLARIVGSFTGIAIFISCLGLFGLAAFSTEQRRKEIGIRKVLGAGVPNIVQLLSVDFLKPVLLSFIIAFPAAWFLMDSWLENFAYRITVQWWMFAIAAGAAVSLALITVSLQTIRSALTNPVKSLRTE